MGRVVVEVMPKPEILDPQGKAIGTSLNHLGFTDFEVRQGKRFEITFDGPASDEVIGRIREAADTLLSNSVIENVVAISDESDRDGQNTRPVQAAAATATSGAAR